MKIKMIPQSKMTIKRSLNMSFLMCNISYTFLLRVMFTIHLFYFPHTPMLIYVIWSILIHLIWQLKIEVRVKGKKMCEDSTTLLLNPTYHLSSTSSYLPSFFHLFFISHFSMYFRLYLSQKKLKRKTKNEMIIKWAKTWLKKTEIPNKN